ncbi:MAG: TolC family protein [Candidatus Omnitrophica bacterium]|nr:TolC family protein [Candidatus Omnitrophota bacterium]MDD5081105.1 TolC family protein [Candidatus Omnitrophota bacterium]MDD5441763.1 TolC family protein [Candidatus Omnitrophota bacterium]
MGRLNRIISGLFFLLLCLNNAYSDEALTWQDCVVEAYNNHPDLISAAEDVKQARADKSITLSTALPQIKSTLSKSRSGGSGATDTKDSYSYGLTVSQLLFDGFKTINDLSEASETLRAAEYEYSIVSSNVRLSLKKAFFALLKAQELIGITEDIAQRRKQNLELVKLRYEAGREHEGSMLTAQADLAQAEFEVEQAKRSKRLAQRQLMKELGRDIFLPVSVIGDFNVDDKVLDMPDFDYLADNTPLVNKLIAKQKAAKFGLESAKSDFMPEISLNGSWGKSDSGWPPDPESWSAGLSVSLSLFEGGSKIAGVTKARSQFEQACADVKSQRDSVVYSLEETWMDFQDAMDNVLVKKKYLEAYVARAKIANAQYSTGLISFDDWIIIEDNLVSYKKAFLDSQTEMMIAEAVWVQTKGGVLMYEK